MKYRKELFQPVLVNRSEDLKSWELLLNIKSQSSDKEKKKDNDEKNDYAIQITFLKERED